MSKFFISLFFVVLLVASCSNSAPIVDGIKNPQIEHPKAKQFVLGKWVYKRVLPNPEELSPWQKKINESIEKSKPPILYLTFREDNVLVFVNCMPGECGESDLPYRINENGFIEIDAKGEEPIIVKKIAENEIILEPRVKRDYIDPPLYYFFHNWTRLTE